MIYDFDKYKKENNTDSKRYYSKLAKQGTIRKLDVVRKENHSDEFLVFSANPWQMDSVYKDVISVCETLHSNIITADIHIHFDEIIFATYVFNPYTKTGRISMYPCKLIVGIKTKANRADTLIITYDKHDKKRKAEYTIGPTELDPHQYTAYMFESNNKLYVKNMVKDGNR